MPAPTPIASADFKSSASVTAFCSTTAGTSLASFTFDATKGCQLPTSANYIELRDVNNYTSISGDWCFEFKIERLPVVVDETYQPVTVMDSTNTTQATRSPNAFSQILYITDNTFADGVTLYYYYGNTPTGQTYLKAQVIENSAATQSLFFQAHQQNWLDDLTDSTGTNYLIFHISRDATAQTVSVWINGQLMGSMATTGNFNLQQFRRVQINGDSVKLGIGAWFKDCKLYNQKFDPVVFSGVSTGLSIKLAGGVDSFWDGALNSSALFGAGNIAKGVLEYKYGITTTIVNGLELNGQGYYTSGISNASIDAVIAQNPTFVCLSPSVNDLALASAAWSTGTFALWSAQVEAVVNRIGNSGVSFILILPMWPWLNSGSGAGYGGTNTRGGAFYTDPSLVKVMNQFFISLKDNTNILSLVRNKIINCPEFNQILGCDIDGKLYNRQYTIGSHTSGKDVSNLHPTYTAQIKVGRWLAEAINRVFRYQYIPKNQPKLISFRE